MGVLKVTAVLPYKTGFARDCTENTFWFGTDADEAAEGEIITALAALGRFYTEGLTTGGASLTSKLSTHVTRAVDGCYFRLVPVYTPTGAELSEPLIVPWQADTPSSGTPLPNEVAICLSFHGGPSIINVGRRRGRVYLGPFGSDSISSEATVSSPHPSTNIIELIAGLGNRLKDDAAVGAGGGTPAPWQIYSRASRLLFEVTGGHVDNEWDTQRRRGLKANARTTFD